MKRVTDQLSVTGQITLEDVDRAAREGFRSIINNRPDGEEDGQPTAGECARRARQAGLEYYHVPTPSAPLDPAAVDATRRVLAQAPKPILAHCRSGQRSFALWLIEQVRNGSVAEDAIDTVGHEHGFDVEPVREWLRARRESTVLQPMVDGFYDPRTFSVQYIVRDPTSDRCAIIDPVLDYDEKSGSTATHSADRLLEYVHDNDLTVEWILDTHPHADHFSAAHYLQERTGAPTAIGERVVDVQALWKDLYGMGPELSTDGSQWDRLFAAGDTLRIGALEGRVLFSPGHTLASITYVIGDAAFVHDTLFMPDFGTARADFPGGDAAQLWRSIEEILALPDETRIYVGHDYRPNGRAARWESSVAEQKTCNPHVVDMDEQGYVALREGRDRQLPMPKLILHALQVNIRGGRLPEPAANGRRYLTIPLDSLWNADWELTRS
jgi:uncharacterized protein (TIGR01244 family)